MFKSVDYCTLPTFYLEIILNIDLYDICIISFGFLPFQWLLLTGLSF